MVFILLTVFTTSVWAVFVYLPGETRLNAGFHREAVCVTLRRISIFSGSLCVLTDGEQEGLRRSTSSPDHSR